MLNSERRHPTFLWVGWIFFLPSPMPEQSQFLTPLQLLSSASVSYSATVPDVYDAHCGSNVCFFDRHMLNIFYVLIYTAHSLWWPYLCGFCTPPSFCLMCAYYCVGILTYMCISRGQRSTLGIFLYFCLPELWRHGFSLNPGFTISVERLTREPTGYPHLCLYSTSVCHRAQLLCEHWWPQTIRHISH